MLCSVSITTETWLWRQQKPRKMRELLWIREKRVKQKAIVTHFNREPRHSPGETRQSMNGVLRIRSRNCFQLHPHIRWEASRHDKRCQHKYILRRAVWEKTVCRTCYYPPVRLHGDDSNICIIKYSPGGQTKNRLIFEISRSHGRKIKPYFVTP